MEHLMNYPVGRLRDSEILTLAEAYDFPAPDLRKPNIVQFRNFNRVVTFNRSKNTCTVQPTDPMFPKEKFCRVRRLTVILEEVIKLYQPPDRRVFYVPETSPVHKRRRRTPVRERLGERSPPADRRERSRGRSKTRSQARM